MVADVLAVVFVKGIDDVALSLDHWKCFTEDLLDVEGCPSALRQDKHIAWN